jgi:hypothetical protein
MPRNHFDTNRVRHPCGTQKVRHEFTRRPVVENEMAFIFSGQWSVVSGQRLLEYQPRPLTTSHCFAIQYQTYDNPSRDNCHVGCKGTLAVELAQEPERVMVENCEHVFTKPVALFVVDGQVANLHCVVDDMEHQPHEPVNKIFPAARLTFEASR